MSRVARSKIQNYAKNSAFEDKIMLFIQKGRRGKEKGRGKGSGEKQGKL